MRTVFLPRLRTGKTRLRDKCGRGRTFGRKGRMDGNFHPKSSVMTTLLKCPLLPKALYPCRSDHGVVCPKLGN
jgi:hypothetical protein